MPSWSEMDDDMDLLSSGATSTLLALLVVYEMNGRATVREVMMASGRLSPSTVHAHLVVLRRCGLVDWASGKTGTLRPTVESVDGPWATTVFEQAPP